ncbi:MAG TPA: ABC transporter permease, partial [Gemmatimonadaceae bacterium]|nr:ABC transporter permease [Gemmatimonadaceae bacterium]
MRIPSGIPRALRLPRTSERAARELDDEIRLHVDMRIAALVASGLSVEQAQAEAMRRFGDIDELRDYCVSIEESHMQRVQWQERVDGVLQDVRFALRQVRKSPGFASIAALTLALGIGAATSIFSVVSQTVLKPLPYPRADRIVQLWEVTNASPHVHMAGPNFIDLKKYNKSFSSMAAYQEYAVSLVSNGNAVRATTAAISPAFFDVLGVKPAAGRLFLPDEQQPDAPPRTVVISYGFWQRQYAGARSAIGATLTADSRTVTIVGVLPQSLEFPSGTDVFVANGDPQGTSRTAHNYLVIGRLEDGVTIEQARLDVSSILRRLKTENGGYTDATDGSVVSVQDQIAGPIKPTLYLLLGASGVLLLIACANVVNLLVARMASRENELAVRVAIGAGKARLVQQLLIEASVLAFAGCIGGLLLAAAGVKT